MSLVSEALRKARREAAERGDNLDGRTPQTTVIQVARTRFATSTAVRHSSRNFAAAAAGFTKPRLVGVVGTDFKGGDLADLNARGIDATGVEVAEGVLGQSGVDGREFFEAREAVAVSVDRLARERLPERVGGIVDGIRRVVGIVLRHRRQR